MHHNLARTLVILIILAILRIVPISAQAVLQYEDTLEIIAAGDAAAVSQTFVITAGDVEITNLQFIADDLLDLEGTLAVPAEAITITPDLVEQLEVRTSIIMTISIDSLPAPGTYSGNMAISYDQQPEDSIEAIALNLLVEPETITETEIITESTIAATDEPESRESPELNLIIATKFDGDKEDISFRILGDETTTAVPLFIRQTGDTELSNVRFFAHMVDSEEQQLRGVSFNLTVAGTDVTETGITIPANEKQVLATLNVMNLTAVGMFTGTLVAEHNGTLVATATLKGERFPLPVLRIEGATEAGAVNLSSKLADFRAQLRLSSTNLTTVEDLKISINNFTDPNGKQIRTSLEVDNKPYTNTQISVAGLGSVDLNITADLPIAGEYTGFITLIYADKRESFDLKVSRTRPNPSVSILGVETAKSQVTWKLQENVSLWMTLHETDGQTVTLNLPQLTVLSLKGAEENTFQAPFENLEVIEEDNGIATESLIIKPGSTPRLKLNILGLSEAGAYVGELMFTAPDMTALKQEITLLVKEPVWVAGIWIVLGVFISFGISIWLKSTRPKLERQLYTNRLLNDLDREAQGVTQLTSGQQELNNVVEDLRYRLEELYDKYGLGTDATAEAALQEIDQKISLLRKLVTVFQQVYALQSPALVGHFRRSLDTIIEKMCEETLASATEAKNLLDKLPTEINAKLQEELIKQLESFGTDVEDQKNTVQNQQIKDRLAEIHSKIDEAKADTDRGDLILANSKLQELRVAYARVLAKNLEESLQDPPFGFKTDAEWDPKKAEISAKVDTALNEQDGERAIAAYQDAYALYLTTLVEKLLDLIKQNDKIVKSLTQISPDEIEKLSGELNSLMTKLEYTLRRIKHKELSSARKEYEEIKNIYTSNKMQKQLTQSGVTMGGIQATIGAVLAAVGIVPEQVSDELPPGSADRHERQRNIRGLLSLGDGIVLVVALVGAIGLGLLLLWADNAIWGGFNDYLVALLWGLGLHQVGNQSVRKVDDVINTWRPLTSSESV